MSTQFVTTKRKRKCDPQDMAEGALLLPRAVGRRDRCLLVSSSGLDLVYLNFAKGSVESTHKVPTSHYHTKHCHAAVVPLGGRHRWDQHAVRKKNF